MNLGRDGSTQTMTLGSTLFNLSFIFYKQNSLNYQVMPLQVIATKGRGVQQRLVSSFAMRAD